MTTPRKPTVPTTNAIDTVCAQFDDLFNRQAARQAFRHYLIGLLLPREHNKTMTVLAALMPGSVRQRLHHVLHDAPWDAAALNARRLQLWREHPTLRPHGRGVLIVDETGDRKRGHGIPFAAQQYIGKVGRTANGVVAVTTHWTDGQRHVPLGVKPYRPAARLRGVSGRAARGRPRIVWRAPLGLTHAGIWLSVAGRGLVAAYLPNADDVHGTIALFDDRSGALRASYNVPVSPAGADPVHDRVYLDDAGTIRVLTLREGRPVAAISGERPLALDPVHNVLAFKSDNAVVLASAPTLRPLARVPMSDALSLAFAPGGRAFGFRLSAQRPHVALGRFDVVRDAVDVRATLRYGSTDRTHEHDVQHQEEDDEVDDLDDERPVELEKHGALL